MGLFKTLEPATARRARGETGNLGPIERSIGYLQGGYKDSNTWSDVQLFNTITQVGRIVYDSGYQRSYQAGITGNFAGYFSINANVNYQKYSYISTTASTAPFSTGVHNTVTSCELGKYSQAWILGGEARAFTNISNYIRVATDTETAVSKGNLGGAPAGTTRQGLSTEFYGFFMNTGNGSLYALNYTTDSVSENGGISGLDGSIQIPCGMSSSNSVGYLVGIGRNIQVALSGGTVLSSSQSTPYTYQFGESHSLTDSRYGFMMAGYRDTTGRYGSQHGLCQRFTLSSKVITTLPDLVVPQSSGQMMEGF